MATGKDETNVTVQWNLLRSGQFEQGLILMRETLDRHPSPSTLMTMGLGYLWTRKYEAAIRLFQEWMDTYKVTADAYFALAGAAQWCLGDPIKALESWKLGLRAQRVDMAGGIKLPLLLWIVSVLRPNDLVRQMALQLLDEKVKDPKVRHWPGPVAQFVLGQIDETTLHERSKIGVSANIHLKGKTPLNYKWSIVFFQQLRKLESGDLSLDDFRELMRNLVDTSVPLWSDEDDFMQLVRNPEFYLARHEVAEDAILILRGESQS